MPPTLLLGLPRAILVWIESNQGDWSGRSKRKEDENWKVSTSYCPGGFKIALFFDWLLVPFGWMSHWICFGSCVYCSSSWWLQLR